LPLEFCYGEVEGSEFRYALEFVSRGDAGIDYENDGELGERAGFAGPLEAEAVDFH
jgi:hypothetical protein